ncbi:MAG: citrate lyase holo-[acyl-carrier protein] synthase [Candidatus Heimdallarchaeaceae archaeon]
MNSALFQGKNATAKKILNEREEKGRLIQFLIKTYSAIVVSIGLNIPSMVRDNQIFRNILSEALDAVLKVTDELKTKPLIKFSHFSNAGSYILLIINNAQAETIKERMIDIEEHHPLGRIFDIDVINQYGEYVERKSKRKCIVCNDDSIVCRRTQRHTTVELQQAFEKIIKDSSCCNFVAQNQHIERVFQAVIAGIISEVVCTPKPGLVDLSRSSAHPDMNIELFIKSTQAIAPFLKDVAYSSYHYQGKLSNMLNVLRPIGLKAEVAMFKATNNVNTQKGLIFSASLVSAAISLLLRMNIFPSYTAISRLVKRIAAPLAFELEAIPHKKCSNMTAGEKAYLKFGIKGARGEAINGFPSVKKALQQIKQMINEGNSLNQALLMALFQLMIEVEDTTLIKRGGIEALKELRNIAREFVEKSLISREDYVSLVKKIDALFIKKNWTIGGCADLLAICAIIYFIQNFETNDLQVIDTSTYEIKIEKVLNLLGLEKIEL